MAKLDQSTPYDWARALKGAADDNVASPLWEFPPQARKAVIHERRRRFGVDDDEGYEVV
ncbi:hypothetical protein [Streptomyces sp. CB02923]|uniref:hypothetical protein n=1 Tax=Streptomyces sp. CB02923 TaxID=1718985 RepID=UPI0019006D40|nr:hypothetical protein [Streptomyces sp. CB02923]